jgi:Protein of unknown function (DUF2442)
MIAERNDHQRIGGGLGIHWPQLDEDISVEAILARHKSYERKSRLIGGSRLAAPCCLGGISIKGAALLLGAPSFAKATARQVWRSIGLATQVLDKQIQVVNE